MRKILVCFLFTVSLIFPRVASANYDPLSVQNNKFGIHIIDTNDINDAASLVNTNGDWGYITFVVTRDDRNHDKWQKFFDTARKLHLIPILRVATHFDGTNWEKPDVNDVDNWVNFLNKLNWVIENRYVIIGNEPNQANEWGGQVNPEEYGIWLKALATRLHDSSNDFFVLSAGLDPSAPNSWGFKKTMDEELFLRRLIKSTPDFSDLIDGISSHSYPNPGFSGSEFDTGRGSIRTYEWERTLLRSMAINKKLPIFITETGWLNNKNGNLPQKYTYAFQNVWGKSEIVAVTPFVLNYKDIPFETFSWKKSDGSFYDFFDAVRNLAKVKGVPKQRNTAEFGGVFSPPIIFKGTNFIIYMLVKNTGQAIWNKSNISVKSSDSNIQLPLASLEETEPGKTAFIKTVVATGNLDGNQDFKLNLNFNGQPFGEEQEIKFFVASPAQITKLTFIEKIRIIFYGFIQKFTGI